MLDKFLMYLIHAKHEVTLDRIPRNQPTAILGIKTGCLGDTWIAWVFPLLTRAMDVNLLKEKGIEPLLGSMYIHGTDVKWSGGHSVLTVVLNGSMQKVPVLHDQTGGKMHFLNPSKVQACDNCSAAE